MKAKNELNICSSSSTYNLENLNDYFKLKSAVSLMLVFACLMLFQGCRPTDVGEGDVALDPDIIYPLDSFVIAHHSFDEKIAKWYESSLCCSWAAQASDSVKRAGAKSVRFELRRHDSQYEYRSQLGRAPNNNREGWFGFSLYFPAAYVKDSLEESIVEWQALPDFSAGEQWRSAPLFLGVLKDRFVLEIRVDSNKVTQQYNDNFTRIDLGPVEKDRWLDWVFHIKWAYDKSGIVEVWKQNKMVFSRIGQPNRYNDETYPYFKVGINKWDWKRNVNGTVNSRVMFVDEVTVGNERARYKDVFPGR
ncbi:polysaccharide lyase [Dyadobacter sp. CY107]|uniref:polysaccharide lyase n=1 Tax=Dyadobacter fanqingshengii TaxID=2906443 RepID=UPI001F1D711F|nr:polysaccharide lyase [Dyadobacter fanqingshengii]MCF2504666.1 polysaccharide lyase [Dyadobacter fanqingshengii]